MFIIVLNVIITIITIAILAWYIYYLKWTKHATGITGPTPIPLLGNVLEIAGSKTFLHDVLRLMNEYGKVFKLMLGIEPLIIVADYNIMEYVLRSMQTLDKGPMYCFFHNWLNFGLVTSTGEKWKYRRHILTPTFHFQVLSQFLPTFERNCDILVDALRKNQHLEAVDIYPFIRLLTLDIICETAMGVSINAQLNDHSAYVKSTNEMCRIIVDRMINPSQRYELTYWFSPNYHSEKKCLKVLHDFTKSVIIKRRQELQQNAEEQRSKKRLAFLDLLLQTSDNGKTLTDEDIEEEVNTFMFAGHETVTSAISFALYAIARHADVQARIVAEQNEIFGNETREITSYDLNQMRYLEMVIKETLRLYPPVPYFTRQSKVDLHFDNGICIPAGTTIFLLAFAIHHDAEFFPNPEQFDPERFLAEGNVSEHPFSYIPFSGGHRNCIGQKFALMEMKTIISKIIRHFQLSPVVPEHKLAIVADICLHSETGMFMKLEQRGKQ